MHIAGDQAADSARRLGPDSREARRLRMQARSAQQQMLLILGYTHEEIVARMSQRTKAGLDAIALMR
jgi:hypothetical protein